MSANLNLRIYMYVKKNRVKKQSGPLLPENSMEEILEGQEQQLLLQTVEREMREEQQSFYKQLREKWRSKKQQTDGSLRCRKATPRTN